MELWLIRNFVVQNGLTVGGATIFAGNSDIRTSGNITITGSGTINVPSFGVSSISMNDSSVSIDDTGPSGSKIELALDNASAGNISSGGMNLPTGAAYQINQIDVLSYNTLKSGVVNSSLTSVGTLQNLTVSGNTAINNTLYGRGVYDNSNRVVSTSSGAGNLTISGTEINLSAVGPGATTTGSASAIPVITIDAYGRISAISTAAVSSTLSTAGTSGTGSISLTSQSLTFAGSYGVTASASNQTITIATPQDLQTTASPTFAGLTASGVVKPNANASVTLGATNAYWNNFYAVASTVNQSTVGGQGLSSAGVVQITNNSTTTSAASGALQVTGGVGIGGNLYITGISTLVGNVNIGGNLTVSGASVSIGASDLAIQDPIINLHTYANLEPLLGNDGADIGIKMHYYDNADRAAFLGRDNGTGFLEWWAKGTDGGNIFNGTDYGTIKSGEIWLANTTTSTSTTTGALRVGGGAGIAGDVYVGGIIDTTSNAQATSTSTGALQVTGGASITTGNLYIGGSAGTAIVHTGHILPSSNLTANLGSSTAWYNTFFGVSTQARYADLAENYQADAIYEPGTVLMFGGEAEVTVADADTTAVAGVVSTNPAHLMNGALQGARVVPIALQGRVPCRVIGPVTKGDILVSAGFGYAKTAPDRQLGMKFGQAIGKALENVSPGTKATIEVVVGRV
jgi:hypothetical protein